MSSEIIGAILQEGVAFNYRSRGTKWDGEEQKLAHPPRLLFFS